MPNSQLEEKIYSLDNIIRIKLGKKYSSFPIEIKHWLPLLVGDWTIGTDGTMYYQHNKEGWEYPKYDFKKSFKEQSPEFHQFLMENIK